MKLSAKQWDVAYVIGFWVMISSAVLGLLIMMAPIVVGMEHRHTCTTIGCGFVTLVFVDIFVMTILKEYRE